MVVAGLSSMLAPAAAHAAALAGPRSATGCNLVLFNKAGACIAVHGNGNYVEEARGGAVLRPRTKLTGGWEIYDTDGQMLFKTLMNYKCEAGNRYATCWGVWRRVNIHLPVGDHICVKFLAQRHAIYGPACEEIR
jgi:hypothetical protein